MHPESLIQIAEDRARELHDQADRQRLTRAVARSSGIPSPRQRLGRRLISFGERLVRTGPCADELLQRTG